MIPVFIAPTISRFDLLERMLLSVDEAVGRGLIVDNSLTGSAKRSAARAGCGREWRAFTPPFGSLGYPGSINFGIVQTADAPWWLWCSNDVVFSPGDLAAIAKLMNEAGDSPRVVTYRFAVGALNRACVETVGLFDEWSFWPLYFDDQDFAVRCHRAGIEVIHEQFGITEGADGFASSLTINSDAHLAAANARSYALNEAAFLAKWGGPPGGEQFASPWNSGLPLWATRPSPAGRSARSW